MKNYFNDWAIYQKYYGDGKADNVLFKLMADLTYHSIDGAVYIVPQGFITDLGSIPRFFWNIIARDSAPSAFVTHDYLCDADWISRRDADNILREALSISNIANWRVSVIYWAVRLYATLWRIK